MWLLSSDAVVMGAMMAVDTLTRSEVGRLLKDVVSLVRDADG